MWNIRKAPAIMRKRMYLFILWLISKKQTHGYGLIKELRDGGFAAASAARLYPLLNMMLKDGLISQREEKQGRRVKKVYMLTAKGFATLKEGKKMFKGIMVKFLKEMIS